MYFSRILNWFVKQLFSGTCHSGYFSLFFRNSIRKAFFSKMFVKLCLANIIQRNLIPRCSWRLHWFVTTLTNTFFRNISEKLYTWEQSPQGILQGRVPKAICHSYYCSPTFSLKITRAYYFMIVEYIFKIIFLTSALFHLKITINNYKMMPQFSEILYF